MQPETFFLLFYVVCVGLFCSTLARVGHLRRHDLYVRLLGWVSLWAGVGGVFFAALLGLSAYSFVLFCLAGPAAAAIGVYCGRIILQREAAYVLLMAPMVKQFGLAHFEIIDGDKNGQWEQQDLDRAAGLPDCLK